MTTVKELFERIRSLVAPLGSDARWTARIIMENALDKPYSWLLTYPDRELEPSSQARAEGWAKRVVAGEPLQYVLGHDDFYGLRLEVNPSVLIPRPETAMLVDMIVKDAGSRSDLKVLDVGTGSGAIALALASALTFPQVTGVDISDDALAVARSNAEALKLHNVEFRQADALSLSLSGPWDIVVSNPPYVLDSERSEMEPRVLDHEPALALFVPDAEPLKFYTPIAEYAARELVGSGILYFECNPLSIKSLMDNLTRSVQWSDVEILRDDRGKERFLKAVKA